MCKRILFLLVLLPGLFFGVKAQYHDFRISAVTDASGKSPGGTFAIAEDELGFIWLGTLNGLVRYDGYGFRHFTHSREDEKSISANMIRTMYMDGEGVLWIGTQGGGLNAFDVATESFTRYVHNPQQEGTLSHNDVWSLAEDYSGNLWIGTWGGGLCRLEKSSGKIDCFEPGGENMTVNEDGIRALYVDSQENVWMGMHSTGLIKRKAGSGEFVHYMHKPDDYGSIPSNEIYHITEDQKGQMWVSTFGGGTAVYCSKSDRFETFSFRQNTENSLSSNHNYHMVQDKNGLFWIANEWTGIDLLDAESHTVRNLNQDMCDYNSLSSGRIRFLFEDSNGIIWAGNETGVDKIVSNTNFTTYRHIPSDFNSLNTLLVRSMYKDREGLIWVGSFDVPLVAYDRQTQRYLKKGKIIEKVGLDGVTSMTEDHGGNFWVGTSNGIYVFNRHEELIHRFLNTPDDENSLSSNTVHIIRRGAGGTMWVGTEQGLNVYHTESNSWVRYLHDPDIPASISNDKIQPAALIVENSGEVWAGTWGGGLNYFDPKSEVFKRYMHTPQDAASIPGNEVISLHKDSRGMIWIGTFGKGLSRLDPAKGTFTHYDAADGLSSDIVFGILEDSQGFLWLSTDNGLSRFHPEKEQFRNFDASDGLPGNQFFWGAAHQSSDGEMFFGATEGMVSFYPEDISFNMRPAEVRITDLKKHNESVNLNKSVSWTHHFEFDHHNAGNLQIEFSAMDFHDPQKNQFAYRLSPQDAWIYLGNRNFINFSAIPPGHHHLQIKASNNDGIWNEQGVELRLIIHPPFWQTHLFRAGVLLLVLLSFFMFYRIRTLKVKRQKRELEGLVELRTQELAGANAELRLANRELQNQQEELESANEELFSQREVLKSTLDQLQVTQKQLIHSEKMASLGGLAAGVAHEINNPLNFIHQGIVAIENHLKDHNAEHAEEIAPLMDVVYAGVRRASEIVASLNHYSRKDELKFKECEIHSVIDSCLLMLSGEIKGRIEVIKEFFTDHHTLCCNEGRIHQAVLNILSNAAHAISGKGTIIIKTTMTDEGLKIAVTDNGCGISDHDLKRITDPFYTTKDPGKGTGLGLSITQNIIDEHNGSLRFESEYGKGTTVTIIFPAQ